MFENTFLALISDFSHQIRHFCCEHTPVTEHELNSILSRQMFDHRMIFDFYSIWKLYTAYSYSRCTVCIGRGIVY